MAVGAILLARGLLPLVGASVLLVWLLERAGARLGVRGVGTLSAETQDLNAPASAAPPTWAAHKTAPNEAF